MTPPFLQCSTWQTSLFLYRDIFLSAQFPCDKTTAIWMFPSLSMVVGKYLCWTWCCCWVTCSKWLMTPRDEIQQSGYSFHFINSRLHLVSGSVLLELILCFAPRWTMHTGKKSQLRFKWTEICCFKILVFPEHLLFYYYYKIIIIH